MKVLVIFLLILSLIGSTLSAFPVQQMSGNTHQNESQISASSQAANIVSRIGSINVSSRYEFLPNFNAVSEYSEDGHITLTYDSAPAPMGVADVGLFNSSGSITPYSVNTTGIMGAVDLNSTQVFYLYDDQPYSFAVQLNAVAHDVDLFGNSSYSFWAQNVVIYSTRTHQLSFIDNVWNFSSPAFNMTANALHGNGKLVPGVFYYDIGPTFNISFPFSLKLYLNSSLVGGNDAIYFNYSIENGKITKSGSYDAVTFNSSGKASSPARFLISGYSPSPAGLLYDAELAITGPGGGSNVNVYGINGTMGLYLYNSTSKAFNTVRSAYDAGVDTGETSYGVDVGWYGNMADLQSGPSLIYGLWNVSSGIETISGTAEPQSYIFVSNGKQFNNSTASWAPYSGAHFRFKLPKGSYSLAVLRNLYAPEYINDAGTSPSLNGTSKTGDIYAPVVIENYSDALYYSRSGNGSQISPFVISFGQTVSVDPLFGVLNDYLFPVFTGLAIINTSYHIDVENASSFEITYGSQYDSILASHGLGNTNWMGMILYGTSNVSITGGLNITGWFPETMKGFVVANLMVWNSSNDLIADNVFYSLHASSSDLQPPYYSSVLIYGMNSTRANNTVWGNYFPDQYVSENGDATVGLFVDSSGNLIYNNAFTQYDIAFSPDFNIYTDSNATYHDNWNISSVEPINYTINVNGYSLNGSIVGGGYEGGNYWGSPFITPPWNESGYIDSGYDYHPLVYFLYELSFAIHGLPAGTSWELVADGVYYVGSGPYINITEFNFGNTTYAVFLPPGYISNASGYAYAYTDMSTVNVYARHVMTYGIVFHATNYVKNETWYLDIAGSLYSSTSQDLTVSLPNGTYSYSVFAPPNNYTAVSGYVTVNGVSEIVNITFPEQLYRVVIRETGLPAGSSWYVVIDGKAYYSNGTEISILLPNGRYSVQFPSIPGYKASPQQTAILVSDQPVQYTEAYTSNANYDYYLGAGIIIGAMITAFVFYIDRRRR
ncbi:MAG: thermopsin family protease [Thermoplasma acidophilum]|nr:thermopsin family protease [Thermoplasma acidophilum]